MLCFHRIVSWNRRVAISGVDSSKSCCFPRWIDSAGRRTVGKRRCACSLFAVFVGRKKQNSKCPIVVVSSEHQRLCLLHLRQWCCRCCDTVPWWKKSEQINGLFLVFSCNQSITALDKPMMVLVPLGPSVEFSTLLVAASQQPATNKLTEKRGVAS